MASLFGRDVADNTIAQEQALVRAKPTMLGCLACGPIRKRLHLGSNLFGDDGQPVNQFQAMVRKQVVQREGMVGLGLAAADEGRKSIRSRIVKLFK